MWLRSIVLLSLISAIGAVAVYRWYPNLQPGYVEHDSEPGFDVHSTPIVRVEVEPADFGSRLRDQVKNGQFDQLDALAVQYRHTDELFVGGVSKLSEFYRGLSGYNCGCDPNPPAGRPELGRAIEAWVAARPQSIAAKVTLADFAFTEAAYEKPYDGSAAAYERWLKRGDELSRSESTLVDLDPADDPEISEVLLNIGGMRNWDHDRLLAIYNSGHKAFPRYYTLVQNIVRLLQPCMMGEDGELRPFLEDLRSHDGVYGKIAYSYAAYTLLHQNDSRELFTSVGLNFREAIEAYQLREQYYGMRQFDWTAVFALSAAGLDCLSAHVALQHIGKEFDPKIYSPQSFDQTVAWFHASTPYKT